MRQQPNIGEHFRRGNAASHPDRRATQDEALVGQKNGITRRWAKKGTRPSAPHDQRTASAYLFGALCPKAGKAAGLVLPRCTTAAMNAHLIKISQAVAPGAHAMLILDKAGWHTTAKLTLPANITLLPLPPRCPELNSTENIWQYMRDNWLSNLVFKSYDQILDTCCEAWTSSSPRPTQSHQSDYEPGLTRRDQCRLV